MPDVVVPMMPEAAAGFDLYDDLWRDCWVAATSSTRLLRKRQVDLDIRRRVAKLLEEYGPQSQKPLTLRIYGTLIKGFAVINNERTRSLYADAERLVLQFARRPFTEADNHIKLPAAKKPRMEAALTLDIDLARVEASEAFDWTQAPLEEGSLLRLGGLQLPPEEGGLMQPSLGLELGGMLPGDHFGFAGGGVGAGLGGGLEATGWLPKLDGAFGTAAAETVPPEAKPADGPVVIDPAEPAARGEEVPPGVQASQLVPFDETVAAAAASAAANAAPAAAAAEADGRMPDAVPQGQLEPARRPRPRYLPAIRPGRVYGFDDSTEIEADRWERWQAESKDITLPRVRPAGYAAQIKPEPIEHLGPWLRYLVDPPLDGSFGLFGDMAAAGSAEAPPAHQLEGGPGFPGNFGDGFAGGGFMDPAAMAVDGAPMHPDVAGLAEATRLPPAEEDMQAGNAAAGDWAIAPAGDGYAGGGAEIQDDRTAEVGAIIKNCLKGSSTGTADFHELVPPSAADRPTAACTFAALLALATAGELRVAQDAAYGRIVIS
eukprot:TRINITY_DN36966_c0_g1_i2.p1 TRINITY_DN36966_c0_g1~~TRINITY_DN36966_c0_g1_i2.p1  ORF type:complete len:545 (-),score=141.14 TRINITY_DN36966_c0_g1_i2:152-1786(-)